MTIRDEMPITAAFIDDLRSAFGDDINDMLKLSRGFFASENGHVIGERWESNIDIRTTKAQNRT